MNQALHNEFTQELSGPTRFELTSTQLGIFLADHLSSINDLYTIAHCLELPKSVDLSLFKEAIQIGLNEADTVIASYSSDASQPFIELNNQVQIQIEEFDFCHLTPKKAQQRLWTGCHQIVNVLNHLKRVNLNCSVRCYLRPMTKCIGINVITTSCLMVLA